MSSQMEMFNAALSEVTTFNIHEKASMLEAVSALMGQEIEMPNRYSILDQNDEDMFFAAEQTYCWKRQAKQGCPDCAPWNLQFLYTKGGSTTPAFELKRGWTCTCCCLNRPKAELVMAEGDTTVGYVRDPCACCNLTYEVLDAEDNPMLTAEGGCCQPGLMCPCPCGPCSKVHFQINDSGGQEVGHITKEVSCCHYFFAPDVDNYVVDVENMEDVRLKALAMALAIFIDFRYFSNNSNDDKHESGYMN